MRRTVTLRNYLLPILSFLTLVPHAVLGLLAMPMIASISRKQNAERMTALAGSLASDVNTFLGSARLALTHEAAIHDLNLMPANSVENALEMLRADYNIFTTIIHLDREGKIRAISPAASDYHGLDMSNQGYD